MARQLIVVDEDLLEDETNGILRQLAMQAGRREKNPALRVWSIEVPSTSDNSQQQEEDVSPNEHSDGPKTVANNN